METSNINKLINQYAEAVEPKMIEWRRDFHEHPELGNQEFRTSKAVADHLRELGFDEVRHGVAGGTGVIGILKGGKPGPVVGLRADMDALPIKEETDVPFASKVTSKWGDQEVPVMHACGHDAHTAMQMAAAEVFSKLRAELAGTVMLFFQPAEEAAAPDWVGDSGADLMVKELLASDGIKPAVMFGLHVDAFADRGTAGRVTCHTGVVSYAMDMLRLTVNGMEAHAATPWKGIDAGVAAAQVLLALQTIMSRNVDVMKNHATLSIGTIHGGKKFNVVPDRVVMEGALRITDASTRAELEKRVTDIATHVAAGTGASADVNWYHWYPQLYNNPELVDKMFPSLEKAVGKERVAIAETWMLDDFSHFSEVIPSIFLNVSVVPEADDPRPTGGHHTPLFFINESALINGLKAMLQLTFDYMAM